MNKIFIILLIIFTLTQYGSGAINSSPKTTTDIVFISGSSNIFLSASHKELSIDLMNIWGERYLDEITNQKNGSEKRKGELEASLEKN